MIGVTKIEPPPADPAGQTKTEDKDKEKKQRDEKKGGEELGKP
jgi:hypothetical protein